MHTINHESAVAFGQAFVNASTADITFAVNLNLMLNLMGKAPTVEVYLAYRKVGIEFWLANALKRKDALTDEAREKNAVTAWGRIIGRAVGEGFIKPLLPKSDEPAAVKKAGQRAAVSDDVKAIREKAKADEKELKDSVLGGRAANYSAIFTLIKSIKDRGDAVGDSLLIELRNAVESVVLAYNEKLKIEDRLFAEHMKAMAELRHPVNVRHSGTKSKTVEVKIPDNVTPIGESKTA